MIYVCCRDERGDTLREPGAEVNGIDYLEVADVDATRAGQQRLLLVHFLNDGHLATLKASHVVVAGGERITGIHVTDVRARAGDPPTVLAVTVDRAGDFSTYELRLSAPPSDGAPFFDPLLSSVPFSFKVDCPSDIDCRSHSECPEPLPAEPDLDYLAKDYASFRGLVLDRMARLMPSWTERNVADVRMALVEVLAYVGDHLSYRQDAVATESYLALARRRVSVRRHARLVDYRMRDGCNARAWVHLEVDAEMVDVPKQTRALTQVPDLPTCLSEDQYAKALERSPLVFETMERALLFQAHNEIAFSTLGNTRCCLPQGATRAWLVDPPEAEKRLRLRRGDVLIFEERVGPITGFSSDADIRHRHAVRLTRVEPEADEKRVVRSGVEVVSRTALPATIDPVTGLSVVEIEWAVEDALPFPLCLSTDRHDANGTAFVENVSMAVGNNVLVDHGRTFQRFELPPVPDGTPRPAASHDMCEPGEPTMMPARFTPRLKEAPVTQAAPYDATASATAAISWAMDDVVPVLALSSALNGMAIPWTPRQDLLNSPADANHFVIEIEHDGAASLRFGDDHHAKRPDPKTVFTVNGRVGNGVIANVSPSAIAHVVSASRAIVSVRNPLPGHGGLDPETVESVRLSAPYAFRTQERAVTTDDYRELAGRRPGVQRATATFRWTGSWHTAFVTVDRQGGAAVDARFASDLRRDLERYRMAGVDLEVNAPTFVPLEIEMQVCVAPYYQRSHVRAELLRVFSNGSQRDGRPALFHPDRFTFATSVYLSPLYAAAQAIEGVASVHIGVFQRLGRPDPQPLADGRLTIGRLEIARLDNDPSFPDRGVFRLQMGGGR